MEGCLDITLHVYCYADTQPASRALAHDVSNRMLPRQGVVGDGSIMHVCNGGIIDSGVEHDKASGDRKRYWTRLVLRIVVE
jgi:hypothetical protein